MLSNKTVLPQRSTLFRFVQYTVISVFLFLIVRHLFNYSEELSHIQDISISEIAMLVVLLFGIYLITSEKMLLILKGMNSQEIQRGEWFKIFCISIFINFHITQGANIYRSLKLKSKFNYPYTDTIGLAGFFVWFEILALALFTMVILGAAPSIEFQKFIPFCILSGLFVCVIIVPFALKKLLSTVSVKNEKATWLKGKIEDLTDKIIGLAQQRARMFWLFILSFITALLFALSMYVLFHSMSSELSFTNVFLFTNIFLLSRLVNIVPGNIGVTELICGYTSDWLGGTLGSGLIVAGVFRVLNYFLSIFFGVIYSKHFWIKEEDLEKI